MILRRAREAWEYIGKGGSHTEAGNEGGSGVQFAAATCYGACAACAV